MLSVRAWLHPLPMLRLLGSAARAAAVAGALAATVAHADTLPDRAAVRKLADGVMGSVGADNFTGTMSQLQQVAAAPPERWKEMENRFSVAQTTTLVALGKAQGYEFIRERLIGESVLRLTYLAKYERGGVGWMLVFYKRTDGWVLADVRLDPSLSILFLE